MGQNCPKRVEKKQPWVGKPRKYHTILEPFWHLFGNVLSMCFRGSGTRQVRSGKREVGGGKWELGSEKQEVGSGEAGSGKWEVQSGKLAHGKIKLLSYRC